jgi:hypothetical protein
MLNATALERRSWTCACADFYFLTIDQLQVLYKNLSDLPLYAIAHFRVLREQILRMFRE